MLSQDCPFEERTFEVLLLFEIEGFSLRLGSAGVGDAVTLARNRNSAHTIHGWVGLFAYCKQLTPLSDLSASPVCKPLQGQEFGSSAHTIHGSLAWAAIFDFSRFVLRCSFETDAHLTAGTVLGLQRSMTVSQQRPYHPWAVGLGWQ